ncbi:hypothetical protein QE152_g27260 [Popillia japonica]
MLAARHGADSVVACEGFIPMSECAVKIIALNGFSERIKVVPKRSTDLTVGDDGDMKIRANILVTEVFDTELIGEGALNTFKKAHEELLEKDCIVIPHSAVMYAQIIEGPLMQNWNNLKNVYNEDGELLLEIPPRVKECPGDVAVHDIQLSQLPVEFILEIPPRVKECPGDVAVHDIQLSQLPVEFIKTIVSPRVVFNFDFSGKTRFLYDREDVQTIKVERDGVAQAVFMWWDLVMDINNEVILSCAPYWAHPDYSKNNKDIPWRDHWMQAVYYLPTDVKVTKHDQIQLISCHDEFSVWFNIKKVTESITEEDYIRPFCYCNLHSTYPRTRIGQLNDGVRSKKYVALLEKHITTESVVLILSHGFYHGLIAAKLGAKKVVCVEPSLLSRSFMKSIVAYNNLDMVEVIESADKLRELGDGLKFNIVFGEPHYGTSIVPWDNFRLMYLLKPFKDLCDDNIQVFPKGGVIMAMAVEFRDLHKIRAPLIECEGFKMGPFDELIEVRFYVEIRDGILDMINKFKKRFKYTNFNLFSIYK